MTRDDLTSRMAIRVSTLIGLIAGVVLDSWWLVLGYFVFIVGLSWLDARKVLRG